MSTSTDSSPAGHARQFHENMEKLYGDAYGWSERFAKYHRLVAGLLFTLLALIIVVILWSIVWFILDPEHYGAKTNFFYVFYIIAAPIFGVSVALYRFHIKEVVRNQHFLMGFKRMYLAGSSDNEGFGTDVRKALTRDAFPPFEGQPKEKSLKSKLKPPGSIASRSEK
jgi:hypothetical protein